MAERILITGGAGFVGGHLAERFVAEGAELVVIDDLSTGRRENLAAVADRVELVVGSILDADLLRTHLTGVEAVIHLAAFVSVPGTFDDPVGTAHTNVIGTARLLEECQRAGVRRLVFASSSAVYGDPATTPIPESTPCRPLSPYGVHKLTGEHLCRVAAESSSLDTVSFRYFNIFGARQRADSAYAAAIPAFFARAREGLPPRVFGDGEQTRDFVSVEDIAEANQRALEREEPWRGAVLNVGRGEATRILDLARVIQKHTGVAGEPERAPPRAGDILHSVADVTELERALGWRPEIDLTAGLAALN